MPSHRENVMLSGRLRGMGRDADCTVRAEKVSLPGTNQSKYANFTIHEEPKDLPDGQYDVTFEHRAARLQRLNGVWIVALDG